MESPFDPRAADKRILRIDSEPDELNAICTGIPYCFVHLFADVAVQDDREFRTRAGWDLDHAASWLAPSAR